MLRLYGLLEGCAMATGSPATAMAVMTRQAERPSPCFAAWLGARCLHRPPRVCWPVSMMMPEVARLQSLVGTMGALRHDVAAPPPPGASQVGSAGSRGGRAKPADQLSLLSASQRVGQQVAGRMDSSFSQWCEASRAICAANRLFAVRTPLVLGSSWMCGCWIGAAFVLAVVQSMRFHATSPFPVRWPDDRSMRSFE